MVDGPLPTSTQRYSQELAAYTLRQFSAVRVLLDNETTDAISKLPAAYSRVARAEQLAASGQVPRSSSYGVGRRLTILEPRSSSTNEALTWPTAGGNRIALSQWVMRREKRNYSILTEDAVGHSRRRFQCLGWAEIGSGRGNSTCMPSQLNVCLQVLGVVISITYDMSMAAMNQSEERLSGKAGRPVIVKPNDRQIWFFGPQRSIAATEVKVSEGLSGTYRDTVEFWR